MSLAPIELYGSLSFLSCIHLKPVVEHPSHAMMSLAMASLRQGSTSKSPAFENYSVETYLEIRDEAERKRFRYVQICMNPVRER